MNQPVAQKKFAPGTSRLPRSRHTLALQMARAMKAEQRLAMGERIRELRGPRTQQPIADHAGVTLRAYQAWEAGGGIAWDHLEKLADYFKVSTNYLLYGDDTPHREGSQLDRIERRLEEIYELLTVPVSDQGNGRGVGVADAVAPLVETDESRTPEAPGEPASRPGAQRRRSA